MQHRPVLTLQSESFLQTASSSPGPSNTVMQAEAIAEDSLEVILASAYAFDTCVMQVLALVGLYVVPAGMDEMQRTCRFPVHMDAFGEAHARMTSMLHSADARALQNELKSGYCGP
jgi:hypothetical protein